MTLFRKLFVRDDTTGGNFLMLTNKAHNGGQIPVEWLAQELSQIREGVITIKTDVSTLTHDVRNLGANQGRLETWLTKVEGDVTSLRGFPQKLESVERDLKELEKDISLLKPIVGKVDNVERDVKEFKDSIKELNNFKIAEMAANSTKSAGFARFSQFVAIFSTTIAILSTLILAMFWLFSKTST